MKAVSLNANTDISMVSFDKWNMKQWPFDIRVGLGAGEFLPGAALSGCQLFLAAGFLGGAFVSPGRTHVSTILREEDNGR